MATTETQTTEVEVMTQLQTIDAALRRLELAESNPASEHHRAAFRLRWRMAHDFSQTALEWLRGSIFW